MCLHNNLTAFKTDYGLFAKSSSKTSPGLGHISPPKNQIETETERFFSELKMVLL